MRVLTSFFLGATCLATAFGFACGKGQDAGQLAAVPVATASDAGITPLPPLESEPPNVVPLAKRRDATSSPVVFDLERGGVWTANGDVGSISYVDIDARKVVQEIAVGKDIRSVALSPDFRWIAAVDRDGASVTLLDAESRVARRTIAIGTHPRAAIWDAYDPRWLYVALEDDSAVALIDRTRGELVRNIPVGRLPAGLAVSRQRRELAVTHRIDGRITVLPLDGAYSPADQGPALIEIPLADETGTDDPKVPHGKPFAFESIAWAPDGNVAWVPHELFAPTHPIQFQSTLFPAISVVDLLARAEVQTDPADPNGVIAGRKNLFDAIKNIDETGNLSVLSQTCAAAIHPNGNVGYAVACASEDLITFDLARGIAVDLLRNLPGDHAVGLALDDTGQRAFIAFDQSHSLSIIDTANGALTQHAETTGEPIALTTKDSMDPELREGLKLFFRANASKGDLATTGNNWMSCGGCHLDGFTSTNLVFFEASKIADPRTDANIGHEGLKDLFSTVPSAGDATFDPHDILVAFGDQGGLAPDRTGRQREGALDPSAPTAAARAMATRVARIVARDLPLGPSWLLPGDKPNAEYDGQWCGNCHRVEYATWQKSVHAHAGEDPMVRFGLGIEQKALGPQYARLCAGCHSPVSARLGDSSLTSGRGVTCIGCHDSERLIQAGGNADLQTSSHDWTIDHSERAKKGLDALRDPAFCGGCHQQFVPGTGLEAISTLHEWKRSPYAGATSDAGAAQATRCVDCHAPKDSNGLADHTMLGGNVFMAGTFGDADMVAAETSNLKIAIGVEAVRAGPLVVVTVHNRGAGHAFPTGVTDIREPWVELQALDASKHVLTRYGGPGPDGLIPASAARLGIDIAQSDGKVLLLHELSQTTRITFDRRVEPASTLQMLLPAPSSLPTGAVELDAVLFYRNVRTPYFRAATGDAKAASPDVEVARAVVQ